VAKESETIFNPNQYENEDVSDWTGSISELLILNIEESRGTCQVDGSAVIETTPFDQRFGWRDRNLWLVHSMRVVLGYAHSGFVKGTMTGLGTYMKKKKPSCHILG
jgi:hypothetical protein